jgi:hypothetical protein
MVVAWATVAQVILMALMREGGDTFVGCVTVTACVASLAAVAVSREFDRRRAESGNGGTVSRWRMPLKSLAIAFALIGVPDVTFVAAYWCFSEGRWYVRPGLHTSPALNAEGVLAGAAVALVVASLLRRALWPSGLKRSSRLCSFCLAVSIVALLLSGSWLTSRRTSYRELAREHEVLEELYGREALAVASPDFPDDEKKAAFPGRMRRRYEHAARYPWLSLPRTRPNASRFTPAYRVN